MTAPKLKRQSLRASARAKKLLTTKEASNMTGYTTDHLGLLLRRGDLRGERRGRDWFIAANELLKYVQTNPKPGPKGS